MAGLNYPEYEKIILNNALLRQVGNDIILDGFYKTQWTDC